MVPAKVHPQQPGREASAIDPVGELGRIGMQTRIVVADAGTAASLARDGLGVFSMLGACMTPGCTTTVFGRGTCVAHDPPRLHLPDLSSKQPAAEQINLRRA